MPGVPNVMAPKTTGSALFGGVFIVAGFCRSLSLKGRQGNTVIDDGIERFARITVALYK